MIKISVQGNIYQWEKGRPWLKYVDDKGMVCTARTEFGEPNGMFVTTAEQISTKLARNVHWMVLYQICVFGADLKSNMAARVHNVFSLAEILL
jgi:hypothetical protein